MNLETLKIVITAQTNQITSEVAKAQKSLGTLKDKNVKVSTKVDSKGLTTMTSSATILSTIFDKLNLKGGTFFGTVTDIAQALSAMSVGNLAMGSASMAKLVAEDAGIVKLNADLAVTVAELKMAEMAAEAAAHDVARINVKTGLGTSNFVVGKDTAVAASEEVNYLKRKEQALESEIGEATEKIGASTLANVSKTGQWKAALAGIVTKFGAIIAAVAAVLVVMAPLAAMLAAIGVGNWLQRQSQQAITYDSSLKRVQTSLGELSAETTKWAESNAFAMGMSRDAAVNLLATYSQVASAFTKSDASQSAAAKNLLNLTAVAASKTGRSQADVGERIRSGLLGNTESIEDIGINVNAGTLDTYAAKIYGAKVAYQNLAQAQKQFILYQAIVTQGARQYGTTVQSGPALASAQWTATLQNLKLALSEAFLPIATTVLPALAKFITYIGASFMAVWRLTIIALQFFGLFKNIKGTGQGTMKAADDNVKSMSSKLSGAKVSAAGVGSGLSKGAKAAKEIRKSLAGFDEINNLGANPKDASAGGGSGGGGVGGGGGLDAMNIPDITSGLTDGIELPSVESLATRFINWWNKIWGKVGETVFNWGWEAGQFVGKGLLAGWNGLKKLSTFLKDTWDKAWGALDKGLEAIAPAFDDAWVAVKKGLRAIGPAFKEAGAALNKEWDKAIKAAQDNWDSFKRSWDAFKNTVKTFILTFTRPGWEAAKAAYDTAKAWVNKTVSATLNAVKGKNWDANASLWNNIKSRTAELKISIIDGISSKINGIIKNYNKMIAVMSAVTKITGYAFKASDGKYGIPLSSPHVKFMARGGVLNGPTNIIAGEAGAEAIVPLENNTGWINKIAAQLNGSIGGQGSDRPLTVVLQVGETELGRVAVNSINALSLQEGKLLLNI